MPVISDAHPYILTVSCARARGQVAAISSFLDERSCYIMEFTQFEDDVTGCFFARTVFRAESGITPPLEQLRVPPRFLRTCTLRKRTTAFHP
jgi:formyltetrahydrofolate deformylase